MRNDASGDYQTSLDFVHDILVRELALDESRVLIYDDRTKLPKDDGIFVLISYNGGPRVLANRNKQISTVNGLTEDQEVNMQENIGISVMSRNYEAMYRKEEVLGALKSIYAQQVQERESFRIMPNSNITDLSALEGAAMLKRYDITVAAFTWYSKTKAVDYYNRFSAELNTEIETGIEIPLTS